MGVATPPPHPAYFTQRGARPQSQAAHWRRRHSPQVCPGSDKAGLCLLLSPGDASPAPRLCSPEEGSRKHEPPAARGNPGSPGPETHPHGLLTGLPRARPHASERVEAAPRPGRGRDTWQRSGRRHGGHGHGRHGHSAEGAVADPAGGAHRGRGLDGRAGPPGRALLRQTGRVLPGLARGLHLRKRGGVGVREVTAGGGGGADAGRGAGAGVTFRVRSAVGKDIGERPMALWMW